MRALTFLLLALSCASCDEAVGFLEPQPTNQRDLKRIPRPLRGVFQSTTDSTYLTIDNKTMVKWMDVEFQGVLDSFDLELDSAQMMRLKNEPILIATHNFQLGLRLAGDSVKGHYALSDTIFHISDERVLRRFKGHYFLNFKKGENNWKVTKLTPLQKGLSFSKIVAVNNIDAIKEITQVDTIMSTGGRIEGYRINPSKKELRELMQQSFHTTETFEKLK